MEAVKLGNRHYGGTVNGIVQVFSPAANVGGAILRTARLGPLNSFVTIYSGSVAPTTPGGNDIPVVFSANGVSNPGGNCVLPFPVFIPAGKGLWVTSPSSETGVSLTYDLFMA